MAQRNADVLFEEARNLLPAAVTVSVAPGSQLTPAWVVRWWYSAQVVIPASLVVVAYLAPMMWYADAWWDGSAPQIYQGPFDAVRWITKNIAASPEAVRNWKNPADAVQAWRVVLAIAVVWFTAPVFLRIGAALSGGRRQRQGQGQLAVEQRDYVRCWPVVVLVVAAVQCARAYKQWSTGAPGGDPPRVSMRSVERVLWRAHRTRRGKVRAHHERVLRAHAGRVVAALREAEAEQDTQPGPALQRLTVMLLMIVERYAEGQVGRLLDDEQMGNVLPIVRHGRLRMAAVGTVVVLVMAGASVAGLPEAALGALLPVVVLTAVIAINRGKVPTPGELTDLIIPR